jgi:transcriptional regulator with XRE-family HTH domain
MTGPELRAIRQAMGLLQRELAPRLGITSEHLGRLERGEARITKATAMLVTRISNVSKRARKGRVPNE